MYDDKKEQEPILVRRACRGDARAFAELYAGIYKDLYRFACYTMKQPQEAEDVVSETVIAAYENIHRLKKEGSFRNWMFTILVNKCRNRLRKRESFEELPEDMPAQDRDHAEEYDVRAAFMKLNEVDRLIVACSVLGAYSSEEIGEMVDMSSVAVRSRKARALGRLRQILE